MYDDYVNVDNHQNQYLVEERASHSCNVFLVVSIFTTSLFDTLRAELYRFLRFCWMEISRMEKSFHFEWEIAFAKSLTGSAKVLPLWGMFELRHWMRWKCDSKERSSNKLFIGCRLLCNLKSFIASPVSSRVNPVDSVEFHSEKFVIKI